MHVVEVLLEAPASEKSDRPAVQGALIFPVCEKDLPPHFNVYPMYLSQVAMEVKLGCQPPAAVLTLYLLLLAHVKSKRD